MASTQVFYMDLEFAIRPNYPFKGVQLFQNFDRRDKHSKFLTYRPFVHVL